MHAELEIFWHAILPNRIADGRQIELHFPLELRRVAYIVNPLIEAATELRRDGLNRNAFIGDSRQDDEQLNRALRAVCLIHRNLGDEVADALGILDLAINL